MKLRIQFREVTFPGGIPTVATVAPNLVTKQVTVNGSIWALDADDGDAAVATIPITRIWDWNDVVVTAEYNVGGEDVLYNNAFRVFGYDLGNAVGGTGTSGNPDFIIYFVEQTGQAYAATIAYRQPATSNIYVADATSFVGTKTYQDNTTTILSSPNGIIQSEDAITIFQKANTVTQSPGTTITANLAHEGTWTPDWESPNDSGFCANTEFGFSVIPFLRFDPIATYNVNDVEQDFITRTYFEFRATTTKNELVGVKTLDHIGATSTNNGVSFTTDKIGDIIVTITGTMYSGSNIVEQCVKTVTVPMCSWHEVQRGTCNNVTVYNWSVDQTATVSITAMQNDGSFEEVKSFDLDPIGASEETLEDGVYKLTISRDDNEYIHTIVLSCKIEDCLTELLKNVICNDKCAECTESEINDMSVVVATASAYLFKIQKYYNLSTFLSILDLKTFNELLDLKQIQDKLREYCYLCDKLKTNDCGC